MDKFDLNKVKTILNNLSEKDHFFVSEQHLQTEFIIEASKLYPEYKYYPEISPNIVPEKYKDKGVHFDLLINRKNQNVIIEFKYITNEFEDIVDGMNLRVKSHMAIDIRRYDSWKDIERIESFVNYNESTIGHGYFILITNSHLLWEKGNKDTKDIDFYINEGEHISGTKTWKEDASKGTIKGRESSITIKNDYNFYYEPFYYSNKKNGEFKSLIVEINKKL